jgi:protein TonB
MMQISKPAKWLSQARYLAFIPVALALTFLFACEREPKVLEDIMPLKNTETLVVEEDLIDVIPVMEIKEPIKQKPVEKPIDKNHIFTVVEDAPAFPGGEAARMKFLSENIVYPAEAKEKGIQGTIFVTFVVEKDGSPSDVRIVRGIGGGCDEEVVRVVKLMPNWIPGTQDGEIVRVQFMMPIRFTIPEKTEE